MINAGTHAKMGLYQDLLESMVPELNILEFSGGDSLIYPGQNGLISRPGRGYNPSWNRHISGLDRRYCITYLG